MTPRKMLLIVTGTVIALSLAVVSFFAVIMGLVVAIGVRTMFWAAKPTTDRVDDGVIDLERNANGEYGTVR